MWDLAALLVAIAVAVFVVSVVTCCLVSDARQARADRARYGRAL